MERVQIINEHFFNGKPYGVFDSDGLFAIAPIVDGKLTGKAIRFFPQTDFNDNDAIEGYFEMVDGVFHGDYERFDLNNRLLEEGSYKYGLLDGVNTSYRYTKTKRYIHKICEYEDGVLSGFYKKFTPNGVMVIKTQYSEGLKNGEEQQFNLDNVLISRTNYVNGYKDGLEFKFNSEGQVTNCFRYEVINGISLGLDDFNRVIFDGCPYMFDVKKWYEFFVYDSMVDNYVIQGIIDSKEHFVAFFEYCKKMKLKKFFK